MTEYEGKMAPQLDGTSVFRDAYRKVLDTKDIDRFQRVLPERTFLNLGRAIFLNDEVDSLYLSCSQGSESEDNIFFGMNGAGGECDYRRLNNPY